MRYYLLVLIIFLIPGVMAIEYKDYLTLVEHTPNCLGECYSIVKINKDLPLAKITDFSKSYIKTSESNNLLDFKIETGYLEKYQVEVKDYKQNCVPDLKNKSYYEPVTTYKDKYRYVWGDSQVLNKRLSNIKDTYLKISGRKKIKLGENNIDWKINFMGYSPNWAWWNGTYNYRYPIESNANTFYVPYSVNDTFGINRGLIWTNNDTELT